MSAAGITVVCLAGIGLGCAVHSRQFLDATKTEVRPEPGHSVELGVSTYPPTPGAPFPLLVSLLKIDRAEYRRMDRIKYDVRITNASVESIQFPWSPVPINKRDRPAAGYRHAMFELIVVKRNQPDAVADFFVLYGAPTVSGSLRTVKPGETVTVRLPGILSGSGFQDARNPILFPEAGMLVKIGFLMYAPGDARFELFHEEF